MDRGRNTARNCALGLWDATVDELSRAVQTYVETSQELPRFCVPAAGHFTSPIVGSEATVYGLVKDRLEDRLSELALLGNQLRVTRSALQALSNFATPVNRLPSEVLSYMFLLGLRGELALEAEIWEEERVGEGMGALSTSKAPSRLFLRSILSICHHWCTVVLGTSALWASIGVSCTRSREGIGLFLQRSRRAPLYIRGRFDIGGDVPDVPEHIT
jgi:hypothetical protein